MAGSSSSLINIVFVASLLFLISLLSSSSSPVAGVQALRPHDQYHPNHHQTIISGGGSRSRSLLAAAAITADSFIDCGAACSARCQLSSRPNLCKRACGTCCSRCQCVPSGTSGHLEECACYANMTTRGGKRKCP